MAGKNSNNLKVQKLRHLTKDAIEITFKVPDNLKKEYKFIPGQYLTLEKKISDTYERRTYSISSDPISENISIGIKRIPKGKFSTYIFDNLKEGDELRVFTPDGRFFTDYKDNQNLVFVACGSGITPIISIISYVLRTKKNSKISLYYGNKTIASTMYSQRLNSLKNSHMENLSLNYFFSIEAQDIIFNQGRITKEKIENLISGNQISPEKVDGVFLCGPQNMVSQMKQIFKKHIGESKPIMSELFFSDEIEKPEEKKKEKFTKIETIIKIKIDGVEKRINLENKEENIIDAALRQNIELPFSCKGGMCCTCRCLVLKGEVMLEKNYSLERWEQERGYTLACQAKPKTDFVFLDFDRS